MEVTLDRFGRLVIPKRVREDLDLRPGSVLEVEERADRIVLRVRREKTDLVREDGVLVYTGGATGDLEQAIEAQRRARLAAAWGDE